MARKFLYIIAGIIVLIVLVLTALRLFGLQLSRIAFVPGEAFRDQPALSQNAYAAANMWIARPDIANNPATWLPTGTPKSAAQHPEVAVFFVHPTSYLIKAHWNAPLDDKEANERAALFVRGQASPFSVTPSIWAPRYRQAAFGAFLTDQPEAAKAMSLAYRDVLQAFDAFLSAQKPDTPILLAGHSQGAMHLIHLLKDRVAGQLIAKRIVAVYAVGWPISIKADLPALGLPVCTKADQTSCIMSWQSYAEPAGYQEVAAIFDAQPGLTGKPRGDAYLCTNPLTGGAAPEAPIASNLGTLKNSADLKTGELVAGAVGAKCDAKGYLLIGEGPDLGPYVLPGNNYHVYDYSLFWANVRADVARRVAAFGAK